MTASMLDRGPAPNSVKGTTDTMYRMQGLRFVIVQFVVDTL